MVSATSSLANELRAGAAAPVPLLAFRLPALERTAWRSGLRAARSLERRAAGAFAGAASRILRPEDRIAHDRGHDSFVALLLGRMRASRDPPASIDVRAATARLAAAVASITNLEVDAGWTHYDPRGTETIADATARALECGARERERYQFFSVVGHELRTPLASIRGYLETLLDGATDDATRRRFTRIAYAESLRLARLLDGMFEISLLDLSAGPERAAAARIDRALSAARDAAAPLAAEHGVTLIVEPAPAITVACDGDRLAMGIINLVANAVKHGRRNGTVIVAVRSRTRRTVTVTVDDDGPGIPRADRERIFALGERGVTRGTGSGIGLALVRMMFERAGGRVEAGESPQGGARFTVTLQRTSALRRYTAHGDGLSQRPGLSAPGP